MKTFQFDADNNLTVVTKVTGTDPDGEPVEQSSQLDIQAFQLAAHMPMFESEMPADVLKQAQAIIAALEAPADED